MFWANVSIYDNNNILHTDFSGQNLLGFFRFSDLRPAESRVTALASCEDIKAAELQGPDPEAHREGDWKVPGKTTLFHRLLSNPRLMSIETYAYIQVYIYNTYV